MELTTQSGTSTYKAMHSKTTRIINLQFIELLYAYQSPEAFHELDKWIRREIKTLSYCKLHKFLADYTNSSESCMAELYRVIFYDDLY